MEIYFEFERQIFQLEFVEIYCTTIGGRKLKMIIITTIGIYSQLLGKVKLNGG